MHVLYVHQNFPAQFGHIGAWLIDRHDFRCTFVTQAQRRAEGMEVIPYQPVSGATPQTPFLTRTFENCVGHAHGVYEALKPRRDLKPDLIVAHSGFGSSIFLRELFDAPILNFGEFFYRPRNCDMDYRPDTPVPESYRLRAYTRNAMIMLDLHNCNAAYTPTRYQRSIFPPEFHSKINCVFDGIDTSFFRRLPEPQRVVAGRTIDPGTRVVTYCARGFEKMRGFDNFMKAAKRIYEQFPDVVFVVVGTDRICYGDAATERGEYPSLRERVLAEGDYDLSKFIFTGRIPPADLVNALSISDAHIYLTVPFVLSWSMMNALACGAVVIGFGYGAGPRNDHRRAERLPR